MRACQPKQLSGLFGERRGDHAFRRPAMTKTLPVCRTLNHSSPEIFRTNLKIQDPDQVTVSADRWRPWAVK